MIRNFQPSDYEMICSWYKGHGLTPVLQKHMPEETSFIAFHNNTAVASLGYFKTNTDIALGQNVISNPDVDKSIRKQCVDELFKHLDTHAKQNGFNTLLGLTEHPKLARRYQELGWTSRALIFVAKEI